MREERSLKRKMSQRRGENLKAECDEIFGGTWSQVIAAISLRKALESYKHHKTETTTTQGKYGRELCKREDLFPGLLSQVGCASLRGLVMLNNTTAQKSPEQIVL